MLGVDVVKSNAQHRCADEFAMLDISHRRELMARLCFDRIGQKQDFIVERFHDTENWNETAYFMLMRALDIGSNRKLYESLARILPYRYINLVGHNRRSVEALLLGSSGLLSRLSGLFKDEKYISELQAIYDYDSHKFELEQMRAEEWQLTGHYGDNHPVVRLLQVANILSRHEHLLDSLLNCRTKRDVENLFRGSGDIPRWAHRFLMTEGRSGTISYDKAYMLGINVVAQMQIFYSEFTLREDLNERGLDLLEQLPAENNIFIRRWAKLNIVAQNALESQALLQLSKEYCASMRCDKCPLRRFLDTE